MCSDRSSGDEKSAPQAVAQKAASDGSNRPFGIEKRVAWTTSRFRGTPDPPLPYRAERIFPRIHFKNPTVLTNAPGTDRFFVAEQVGPIFSIAGEPDPAKADPFLDCTTLVPRLNRERKEDLAFEAVYGVAFHPQFATNRYCYVCYVVRYKDGQLGQHPEGTRVSRFTVSRSDPPVCDPASEKLIVSWLQGGHNGGCLKFGPEGFLYISSGDGGPAFPPDPLKAGQDVSNLLSSILRIDVDHESAGLAYTIPRDNPFVELAGARGEIWAYGLRNPWKMTFDRKTGGLWTGDVGWELWEMVYRVHKADNFGWSLYEGPQAVHTERPRGPTPIVPATVAIPHTDGASVTGGYVYRGKKFPQLVGTYVFGDWETRRIWGVNADAENVGPKHEIMDPTVRIVDFGEDNAGELYLLDYDAGTIHSVVENVVRAESHPFPRRLSETGIFESVAEVRPASGVLPYSINAEQWADGAVSQRWVGVPGTGTIRFYESAQAIPGSMFNRKLDFPTDGVVVKTFSLPAERAGAPARRVETQVLHYDGRDWRGYTYEWNDQQTDAVLVEGEGKTSVLRVADAAAPNGSKQQAWRFPSRTECLRCHNPWSDYALAFNVAQLNRRGKFGDIEDNQMRTFRHIGLVADSPGAPPAGDSKAANPPQKPVDALPKFVDPYDSQADLGQRARTYLHLNCGHCHRNGGGGSAYVHLLYELPLKETRLLGMRPTQGTFGIHDAKIVAPGDPFGSVLYFRMAKLGPGHMPYIGSSVIDQQGLALIHDWIRQLPPRPDDQTLLERFVAQGGEATKERESLIDELLSNSNRAALLARAMLLKQVPAAAQQAVVEAAAKHVDAAVRDLFESFVPEEKRVKRLGDSIKAAELLKLAGDAASGKQLFHKTAGVQCKNCHKIAGDGTELGPDLSEIARKHDRAKLLESILEPSKNIEPKYVTWVVETTAGKVLTGLLVHKDGNEVVIKDSQNKEHRVPTGDVESTRQLQNSLMPDLLLRDFTPQQVADLLAYLASLK
ncbi:MAG: PQQ-dependent sugar dehydrogenase [Planctomycetia bacterium]|nr:PQQ-dependent sugar dehydrogenase [Planctomycetia bacterium]